MRQGPSCSGSTGALAAGLWIAKIAFIVLALSACAALGQQVDWHERDSYSGWVTDAATGKPIEGAVVVAVWQILQRHYNFIAEGNPTIEITRLEETVTDKEGRFYFAPIGNYSPRFGWQRDEDRYPQLAFFKPGYGPMYRERFTWEFGFDVNEPFNNPATESHGKQGWQREIQLYAYLTEPVSEAHSMNPIFQSMTGEQRILGRLTGFASMLVRNVGNSDTREAPDGSYRRRNAIESQWRAIVSVDEEIRKYEPRYRWSAGIENVLRNKKKRYEELR